MSTIINIAEEAERQLQVVLWSVVRGGPDHCTCQVANTNLRDVPRALEWQDA